MRKVQDILKIFAALNNSEVEIQSETLTFNTIFLRTQVLHLLGIHYIHADFRNIKGRELLREVLYKNYSDEEIYDKIGENNSEQLDNVKNRVHYFKEFMYNLDKANVVEMTNPKTKIKSHHLLLQSMDNKYLQLGIAKGEAIDYFETFLISSDDFYFKESSIKERVTGIYRYDNNDEPVPFSFDPVKAGYLEYEYKKNRYNAEECVKDNINNTQIDTDNEDEWDIEI